jgi:hypothetical protein
MMRSAGQLRYRGLALRLTGGGAAGPAEAAGAAGDVADVAGAMPSDGLRARSITGAAGADADDADADAPG